MDETRLLLDTINQLEVDCTAVDRQRTGCIPYSEFVFLLLKNGSSRAQADRFVKVFGVQNPNHNEKNRNAWEVNYREMIAYIRKQQNLPERRQDSLSKRSTTTGRSSSTADSPFRRSTTNPNTNHIHINNTNYETVRRTPSRSKSAIERSEDRVLPNQ
ncbi:hypothetical protein ADEAN_000471500 [Angomonas deanei]|uniref:EF-hand domain-containing protein n=1 Tax=Angomonas deanei TaxID=59799 RepID=A0A7G2CE43_9TRYP|nr:hypothetical protein ADEAN_000471500 [Angomonas deanei]